MKNQKIEKEKIMKEKIKKIEEETENWEISIEEFTNYSNGDYIEDVITEIAENNVHIYNSDLIETLNRNLSEIEEIMENNNSFDILKSTMEFEFEENYNFIQENLKTYIYYYILTVDKKDIEIEDLDNIDLSNQYLGDIVDLL